MSRRNFWQNVTQLANHFFPKQEGTGTTRVEEGQECKSEATDFKQKGKCKVSITYPQIWPIIPSNKIAFLFMHLQVQWQSMSVNFLKPCTTLGSCPIPEMLLNRRWLLWLIARWGSLNQDLNEKWTKCRKGSRWLWKRVREAKHQPSGNRWRQLRKIHLSIIINA